MKKLNIILILCLIAGCSRAKVTLTGSKYPPLSESDEVLIIFGGADLSYEVIGTAQISGEVVEKRINEAKQAARANGGNAIIPKELVGDLQIFSILRKKEVSADKGKDASTSENIERKPLPPDIEKLPRATMKVLIDNLETFKGENFRGSLKPAGFVNPAKEIKRLMGKDKSLLMLKTKNEKHILYLIVPDSEKKRMNELINKKIIMDIVYIPVAVYQDKYPVLEFVREIGR